jgi:DNA-binding LacI/PurR family transcriptional regulator
MATVSRVANGSHSVTPRLRERVYKASLKLGFDLGGKNKSKIIAFILSNRAVLHPFHSAVLVGAEAYCAAHDYGLLFLPVRYSSDVPWRDLHLPQVLQRHDVVRGAIVAGTNSQNLLDFLTHKGVGFVTLGNNVAGPWRKEEYSAVYFDDVDGAFGLTRYLLSLGHRQICFVGNCRMPWFLRRYEGYRKAMEEAGLVALKSDVDSEDGEDIGFLATKSILRGQEAVTAIFAGEDTAARGVYKALQEAGLRVPDDISVAGFNDIPEAAALNPPLTSVRVFTDQVGKQMAELVLKKIARPDFGPEVITIPTQLVKRESCGPVTGLVRGQEARMLSAAPRVAGGA